LDQDLFPVRPLEADELRALRHADTICIDVNADGLAQVRALKDARHSSTGFDEAVYIRADNRRDINLREQDEPGVFHDVRRTAYVNLSSARYRPEVVTFLKALRAGDTISVEIYPDAHTNGYARCARGDPSLAEYPEDREDRYGHLSYTGLHVDECKVHIVRPGKDGKTSRQTFLLDVGVCADNSARMVHRAVR
jgi:hypothetical protein